MTQGNERRTLRIGLLAGVLVLLLALGLLALLRVPAPIGLALAAIAAACMLLLGLAWHALADELRAAAVPPPAPPAPVDARRLTALETELASLRGVQKELVGAKQTAESAMLAKSEFLATMSHEIRTPLNGILPLLDIVLGTKLASDQRDYLATAHRSAQELLRIVDDILDYSKVEAGKLELERVAINLRELLENVQALMERAAESKGLALRYAIDDDVRVILRGDPTRLRQIITNLIGNGIKFTERGGVSVRISRRAETASHQELLFAVRDTGIGIEPSSAARLFHPFNQADTSITRRYGGTGLGLTICKRLVELMGGKIGVRSEPGRGSVFWFSVPLAKMPGDIAGARHDLTGLRALFAGDGRMYGRINPLLAGLGITADSVSGGADALAMLRRSAPLGRSFGYELLIIDPASVEGDPQALLRNVLREPKLERVRMLLIGAPVESGDERTATLPREPDEAALRAALEGLYALASQRPEPLLASSQAPGAISPDTILHGRVLLVEDHPVNLQVASRLLSRLGLEVAHAHNGAEALRQVEKGGFDMVLMDCQMPVMDGYAATRELRRRELAGNAPRLPIVAMTAHAMAGDRERCLECGMDDYLSKPLDRGLLARTLAHWLPQPHAAAETIPTAPLPEARSAPEPSPGATTPAAALRATAPPPPRAPLPPPPSRAAAATAAVGSGPAAGEPVLDRAVLADLEDIMGDELRMLVDMFLADSPKRLAALSAAAAAGDTATLQGQAHALKSASANLGTRALSAHAKALELAARAGAVPDAIPRVTALKEAYATAETALRQRFAARA
ncbi:MAG TPA: ATP-binding protein [Rhodanobacteraceae bacterium]|nr:ATP-binding protein [Rhodanobacteraceae bacterium]